MAKTTKQVSKGTIAAFRAHLTRLQNAEAAAKSAEQKKVIKSKISALTKRARVTAYGA